MLTTKGFQTKVSTNILEYVTEKEIFQYYISNFKRINRPFSSELREDKNPSCVINTYNGRLIYKDFSTKESYNCFGYVMRLYSCSFIDAINIIKRDFNIKYDMPKHEIRVPTIVKKEKVYKDIRIEVRDFNEKDLEFWGQYKITKPTLEYYNVYACKTFYINGIDSYSYIGVNPAYAYDHSFYKENTYKILRPFSERHSKWLSNMPGTVLSGINKLKHEDLLIITKSFKDIMVWRELFEIDAVCPQSENQTVFNEEDISYLKQRYKKILINYDNDNTGLKYSKELNTKYNFDGILNIPEVLKSKDISDAAKTNPTGEVISHISDLIKSYRT
jgi:hypothetical protein